MVPWRATEDGLVTPEVLAWYERFARGQPGALVVEATGIRDIPSGPLLRIGDDRFIPGLAELVRTVRRSSDGRTRLFIQIIDFLRIRRRPEPARYFGEFLVLTDRHRALLPGTDSEIREALARLPEEEWPRYLSERELESLRFGERERVTDTELPHIRDLPKVLPGLFAGAARRARGGRIRRRGAALRPRVHDGFLPLLAESPRGRVRRLEGEPGAASTRGVPRRAGRSG